jgi:K+-transporting ATPase ATPase C chain
MLAHLRPSLVLLVLFTVLTGIVYPFAVTGVAHFAFPRQAGGSLIVRNDVLVGSMLIGQNFASDRYFQPRPSATNTPDPNDSTKTIDAPYNAGNSSGSNLGPLNKTLIDRVKAGVDDKRKAGWTGAIPGDALTTSASGLDPEISPQNARTQIDGVARARGLDREKVAALVEAHVEKRWLGIVGEPRANVLLLNLALDALK